MAVSTEDQRTSIWLFSRMESWIWEKQWKETEDTTLWQWRRIHINKVRNMDIWNLREFVMSTLLTTFEIVVLHVQSRNDAVWSMAWYKTKGGSFESVQLWILCPHPQRWEKEVRFQGKKMHTVGIRRQDQRIRLFDPIQNKFLHSRDVCFNEEEKQVRSNREPTSKDLSNDCWLLFLLFLYQHSEIALCQGRIERRGHATQ